MERSVQCTYTNGPDTKLSVFRSGRPRSGLLFFLYTPQSIVGLVVTLDPFGAQTSRANVPFICKSTGIKYTYYFAVRVTVSKIRLQKWKCDDKHHEHAFNENDAKNGGGGRITDARDSSPLRLFENGFVVVDIIIYRNDESPRK